MNYTIVIKKIYNISLTLLYMVSVENWRQIRDSDWQFVWVREDIPLWVRVSHQPDSYISDTENMEEKADCADKQNMRWHGRLTYGTRDMKDKGGVGSITFIPDNTPKNYENPPFYSFCNESSCEEAKQEVLDWAEKWMKDHKYGFEDIPDELEN